MIEITVSVERHRITNYSPSAPKGSGYCDEQFDEQWLVRVVKFWGITLKRTLLDKEIIPEYAVNQLACLGSTDWKSKFAEYIK